MDVKDFKTWFAGFSAMAGSGGLTAPQFAALKQAVEELGSYPAKQEADKEPGPVPATSPVPMPLSREKIQEILDGLRVPNDLPKMSPRFDPFKEYPPKYLTDALTSQFPPGTILFSTSH